MKVLATTSQSVLLVDCISGSAEILHRGAGLYYGIARIGTMYAVAARRRLVSSPVARNDERGCILLFDADFRLRELLEAPFPLRDMHQIAWFDDRLWITCSLDDFIAIHDGASWQRWTPPLPSQAASESPAEDDARNDRYHYNSFFVADDEFAVLAHNYGPSNLHFFDRRSRAWRRSIALGTQAHNVWFCDESYATCSSIEGKLVASNGWELHTGWFPRGVCFDATHRAIGISALRERGRRDWASAAIALHDASWRLLHYVHLLEEGMILDLAPISSEGRHRAALESRTFPLLRELHDVDLLRDQGSSGSAST